MKLSDLLALLLKELGAKCAFGISGGAIVHFLDSLKANTSVNIIFSTNEQFSSFEADGVARSKGGLGICFSTSGPGMTNLITGIASSYYDHIPIIAITGQVSSLKRNTYHGVKQLGFQEAENGQILSTLSEPNLVLNSSNYRYIFHALSAHVLRTGTRPFHLEFPDDMQRAQVNCTYEDIKGIVLQEQSIQNKSDYCFENTQVSNQQEIIRILTNAKKPVFVLGMGCLNLSDAYLSKLISCVGNASVVSTWAAIHVGRQFPNYRGTIGTYGNAIGNSVVLDCDVLVCLGTSLSNNIIGSLPELFAPDAFKIVVDNCLAELQKPTTQSLTNVICLNISVAKFVDFADKFIGSAYKGLPFCKIDSANKPLNYNSTCMILERLLKELPNNCDIFVDTGLTLAWTANICSTLPSELCHRVYSAWGFTPMGYALPAAIGYSIATDRVSVCVIGDGGFMLCISELALLRRHNVKVIILLVDNKGHSIQKQTLERWLRSEYLGVDTPTGLSFCNYREVCSAFSVAYTHIDHERACLSDTIISDYSLPHLYHIDSDENDRIYPISTSGEELKINLETL